MIRKENQLDERQKQKQNQIGNQSFWFMYFACLLVHFIQTLFLDVDGKTMIGTTFVLLIGSIFYTIRSIHAGIWNTSKVFTGWKGALFYAITVAGFATLLIWGFMILGKAPGEDVNGRAGVIFVATFTAVFILFMILSYVESKRKKMLDQKYIDD